METFFVYLVHSPILHLLHSFKWSLNYIVIYFSKRESSLESTKEISNAMQRRLDVFHFFTFWSNLLQKILQRHLFFTLLECYIKYFNFIHYNLHIMFITNTQGSKRLVPLDMHFFVWWYASVSLYKNFNERSSNNASLIS